LKTQLCGEPSSIGVFVAEPVRCGGNTNKGAGFYALVQKFKFGLLTKFPDKFKFFLSGKAHSRQNVDESVGNILFLSGNSKKCRE
jgi:hypothetical protein